MFGLHQCSYRRVWTLQEKQLFHEVGRRLADALDTQLIRDLRESERKLERSRAELAASRARIVTAADETRRQIARDLHDGVQQRLVSLLLTQRSAQAMVPPGLPELQTQLSGIADGLAGALEELQAGTRLPAPVEVAAYYVVSEALTNAAKHANASMVHVTVEVRPGVLELSVRDDGSGGADPARGSGLVGLTDRVEALGGTIEVVSPVGQGTTLRVTLPTGTG